ncbi:hypothetical protein MGL_2453 [Malassezia globosa CBS 7966]|uniref:Uncharacterized protein n=1 Tax=Malassezia globosa (strain ATCC MYA-4612 / CBS 7966) TaxID=425265 RepID=A8Q3N0_MALGO|nr:uncharacterized protein MGL_2453 [Malassezia globosa CBS 7966]EDP43443.1 hypothetical protein MGL_2453 [Malassezia globosa CBS 7966]
MSRRNRSALQSVDFDTDESVSVQLDENYDDGLALTGSGVWSSKGPSEAGPRVSVQKTAVLHTKWAWRGLVDASSIGGAVLLMKSYLIASTWSVGIAEAAFMAQGIKPHPKGGSETAWIEYAVRTVLILNYSLICFALQNLPVVGRILSFLVMSFVDGFFCFEQIWSVRGWPLEKRLRFAESHWSFLMGFGIPSTMISFFHPSGLLNLMLFMLVFPIYCDASLYDARSNTRAASVPVLTSANSFVLANGPRPPLAFVAHTTCCAS